VSARLADELAAYLPAGVVEPLHRDLGFDYGRIGTLLSMLSLGGILGGLVVVAADHASRRILAAGGAFALSACLATFALGHRFVALALATFTMAIATDALVHGTEVALVDVAAVERRSLEALLARQGLLSTVGDIAGPALLAAVAAVGLGWRVAFALAAALLAVYGLALAATPMPAPRAPTDDRPRTPVRDFLRIAHDPVIVRVGLVVAVLAVIDEPFFGFVLATLEHTGRQRPAVAQLVAIGGVAAGLVASVVLERRATRTETPTTSVRRHGAALLLAGTLAVALVPVVAVQALGLAATAAGEVAVWLSVQSEMLRRHPGREGTTAAVVSMIGLLGAAGPPLIGRVADAHGLRAGLWLFVGASAVIAVLARAGVPAPSGGKMDHER
jgi:predicted MFS family arabinose efflux permease